MFVARPDNLSCSEKPSAVLAQPFQFTCDEGLGPRCTQSPCLCHTGLCARSVVSNLSCAFGSSFACEFATFSSFYGVLGQSGSGRNKNKGVSSAANNGQLLNVTMFSDKKKTLTGLLIVRQRTDSGQFLFVLFFKA